MPDRCPTCDTALEVVGAHHFCPNADCPDQIRGRLRFFVGRGQMDIENLGPETLETLYARGLVKDVADIYTFDTAALEGVQGFGEKKIALIREGIEKSRKQPYERVLVSLGVPDLGQKAAEILLDAGIRDIETLLDIADRGDVESLTSIHGIGDKTAALLVEELRRPATRRRIEALRAAGLAFSAPGPAPAQAGGAGPLAGQTWCVTGSFERFKPREKAMDEVLRLGGRVTSSVTSRTTHLLAGGAAGSKLAKARELGVTIVSEEEFLRLIEGH
jgi:DNA ligase (NAD+)